MTFDFLTPELIQAFFAVIAIDLVLAGDNAVVIGMAAAGLPQQQRGKAILIGIIAATVLRIAFALIAAELMLIVGLLFAGGLLLLWVAWKMWRELQASAAHAAEEALAAADLDGDGAVAGQAPGKSLRAAVTQIILADVSMSLDNVLGVAGAAREHPYVLVFGLTLSILLMGLASSLIARVLTRHRWIAFVGLAVILYVALHMMWQGGLELCTEGLPMFNMSVPAACSSGH
ncbi:MAG: membrane protein [Hyphomonas sp. BRH_c22]|uniref:TerC family protein n=1 Tax=Hyphomonas sp. BRH_c22 TaxID=1629710 RepID=UPI0005F13F3E|nr:TerC family protein [Hyphomonas sp. BRH_c22]KJS36629.1 MAG: membrane protein [Hyphomonas sp. BRH_c22]